MNNNYLMKNQTKKQLINMINAKDKEILELKIFEKDLETKQSYSVEDYDLMCSEKELEFMKLQQDYDNLATQLNQSQNKLKKKLNENNILIKKLDDISTTPLSQADTNKLMKTTKKILIEEITKLRQMVN